MDKPETSFNSLMHRHYRNDIVSCSSVTKTVHEMCVCVRARTHAHVWSSLLTIQVSKNCWLRLFKRDSGCGLPLRPLIGEPCQWKAPGGSLDRPLPLRRAPPACCRTTADWDSPAQDWLRAATHAETFPTKFPPFAPARFPSDSSFRVAVEQQRGDARRVLERNKELDEADCRTALLLIHRIFFILWIFATLRLYMAKFLAELLGCALPDKGTPALLEVRVS